MEKYTIENDIPCYRIKASSFPEGVLAAHQQLHALFPYSAGRRYYGISRPEGKGQIAYWAAAEKLSGDAPAQTLETFIIPKGQYTGTDILQFRKDIPAIGRTFQQLLTDPQIDPNGFCLEWYYNMDDVRCMVKLADNI